MHAAYGPLGQAVPGPVVSELLMAAWELGLKVEMRSAPGMSFRSLIALHTGALSG